MTAILVLALFVALLLAAGVVSALDMRPQERPPEWSVGGLLQRRR